jgi:predicted nucleic acid-binding protein
MPDFVVDASLALAWYFEDESTAWTTSLLNRIKQGDRIVAPAHWHVETLNGLWMGVRRKRIRPDQLKLFLDQLAILPVESEPSPSRATSDAILALCEKHGLTVYDSAYLELALRRNLPLGTLDSQLRAAAQIEGATLL